MEKNTKTNKIIFDPFFFDYHPVSLLPFPANFLNRIVLMVSNLSLPFSLKSALIGLNLPIFLNLSAIFSMAELFLLLKILSSLGF